MIFYTPLAHCDQEIIESSGIYSLTLVSLHSPSTDHVAHKHLYSSEKNCLRHMHALHSWENNAEAQCLHEILHLGASTAL